MRLTRAQKDRIRSPRGQLELLGLVFAGALLFAVACGLAREAFFEAYVYEKVAPLPARLESVTAAQMRTLSAEDRRALYGHWLAGGAVDVDGLLADPAELHDWVRGTVVAGSPEQRRRAVSLLPALRDTAVDALAEQTATYAHRRALQLGDEALAELASRGLGE